MKRITRLLSIICFSIASAFSAPILWVNDGAGNVGIVDVANGNVNVIGSSIVLTDIAFDPLGNLFGVGFNNLYSVNTTTGAATLVGSLGVSGNLNSLVFGSDGTLYGASNQLYKINVGTGAATSVGAIGFASAGDLAFLNSLLYLTTATNQLVTLDTTTGSGTLVGSMGVNSMFGLAAPGDGALYGVASTNIYSIDSSTGAATLLTGYGSQGLSAAYGAAFRSEAGAPATVPEPATLFLMGGGLMVAACWRKMRS